MESVIKIFKINRENQLEHHRIEEDTNLDEFVVKRPLSERNFATMVWEYHLIRRGYHCIIDIKESTEPSPEIIKELRSKTDKLIKKELIANLRDDSNKKIKQIIDIIENLKECKRIYDVERIMGMILGKNLKHNKLLRRLLKQSNIETVKGELIGHYLEELKNNYSYDYNSKNRIIIYRG